MTLLFKLILSSLLLACGLAHAHEGHAHEAPAPSATTARPLVHAVVRTVDTSARKITLKHDEIPNLDMGPMTMVFQVQDPALLNKVKAGDTVRFTVDKVKGVYTVLSIEPMQQ